jgi:hypothetical protein
MLFLLYYISVKIKNNYYKYSIMNNLFALFKKKIDKNKLNTIVVYICFKSFIYIKLVFIFNLIYNLKHLKKFFIRF